jgi:tetratricopeptide (TPR) repeat protein
MFRATPLETWYDSPHNVFMEWLVAGGLPGLLLIAALFILMARVFIGTDQLDRAARAIMLGLLTAYSFHCLVGLNDLHGSIHLVTIAAFAHALTKHDALVGRGVQSISDRALIWMLPSALGLALAAAYVINAPGIANARGLFQAMTLGDPASGSVKPPAANLVQFDRVLAGAPLGRQEATQQLLEFAFFLGTRPEGSVDAQTLTSTYDAAHAAALRMIAERPHDARLEFRLGQFLNRFGQSDEAAQHLLLASLLAPSQQIVLLELGINSYLRAHDSTAALPVLRRAFELEPRNIQARVAFALALHLGGQNAEADRVLTEDIDAMSLEQRSRLLKSYRRAINRLELRLAWGARHPETQSALASLRSHVKLSVPGR